MDKPRVATTGMPKKPSHVHVYMGKPGVSPIVTFLLSPDEARALADDLHAAAKAVHEGREWCNY